VTVSGVTVPELMVPELTWHPLKLPDYPLAEPDREIVCVVVHRDAGGAGGGEGEEVGGVLEGDLYHPRHASLARVQLPPSARQMTGHCYLQGCHSLL